MTHSREGNASAVTADGQRGVGEGYLVNVDADGIMLLLAVFDLVGNLASHEVAEASDGLHQIVHGVLHVVLLPHLNGSSRPGRPCRRCSPGLRARSAAACGGINCHAQVHRVQACTQQAASLGL